MRYRTEFKSPIGPLRLFAEDEQLVGLYFKGHSPTPKDISGKLDKTPFSAVLEQLDEFFSGERTSFDVKLDLAGTDFQTDVWAQLRSIPYGQTISYSEIAKQCGRQNAVRAIGAAVGRNPISIIVPCHRVVGANGTLTGFAGGLPRKKWLLDLEATKESCVALP